MNIVITGGGTGGHLSIAKALAIECQKRDFKVIYIGSMSGQDRLWFENSDIFEKCYFLQTTGVVNKKGLGIFKALYLQLKATLECRKIFKLYSVKFVISVGGFSAGGASMASIISRIPLFIHEQNAILGTLNKILMPFSKATFGSFNINASNFIQTHYPINNEFFAKSRIRTKLKCILFLGGSQGAKAINSFAINIASYLLDRDIKIIHQCGKNDFIRVKTEYQKFGFRMDCAKDGAIFRDSNDEVKIDLFSFDDNPSQKMQEADFCVSRAGASSLWELCANNLPCYFIPYPFAAKNHQYFNALFLKERDLCEIVLQDKLNKDDFLIYLDSINLEQISTKLREQILPNGSKEIIDRILRDI